MVERNPFGPTPATVRLASYAMDRLEGAMLHRAVVRDADLTGTTFRGAVLADADFRWALYDAADLADSHLTRALILDS